MKNEVLEELWMIKDKVSEDSDFDVETLANKLRKKELKLKAKIVDFTSQISTENKKSHKS